MSITPKTILTLVAASTALAASSWAFARTAYDAAQPDGYFWYKDKPKGQTEGRACQGMAIGCAGTRPVSGGCRSRDRPSGSAVPSSNSWTR